MTENVYTLTFNPEKEKLVFAPTIERVREWSEVISTKRYSLKDTEVFQVTALETDFPELTTEEQNEFRQPKLIYLIIIRFIPHEHRFQRIVIRDPKLYHNLLGITLHIQGLDNPGWIGVGEVVAEDVYPNQSVIMG